MSTFDSKLATTLGALHLELIKSGEIIEKMRIELVALRKQIEDKDRQIAEMQPKQGGEQPAANAA